MQDKVFYASCFGFIFGVLLRSFVFVDLYLVILFMLIALAIILFYSLISKNKWGIFVGIFILVFSLGIFRFNMVDVSAPAVFESSLGQKAFFSGEIIDEPSIGDTNQKFSVEIKNNKDKTKVLLSVNLNEYLKYGDEINFEGTLEKPENFITDQGKEFDYINYLRKDGIFYVMRYPTIEIVSHGNGNFIKNALFYVKEMFLNKMNLAIREPESLLMGGLILGEKASFDESLRQSFVDTGTIHIVALSGYNVTIVAEWIMKIFSSFPKNIGLGAGIFSILLFVLMTGGSSTAVRAGIMASLALFARLIGRNYDVARALILAGIVMVLINPFVLVFDVSFQLSFIATVAVIFFAPKIEKYFLWVTTRFELRDIISVTCAAYIFVLPFILYKMGNLSLVALPANVLILPFIPFTMILGFLTGFTGIIWYVFAIPFGSLSFVLLHYELSVISFFSNLPFAALSVPNFPFILTLLIYIYFIYRLFGRSIKSFFKEALE
ncbi:MAG: internalization-related competence protein ComEC/Rec2 protein [Candidatus Nomurabacteria bacterium GW2011_GWE1_32_28]|uniref:Internalization-related competence protein ComEC/Rec2 protein n=1 Tax=Candidatus Nomurabacteria bacterium GW2011_GWF1_31_48 TaxID=1618767 RepID=A0A0F9YU57_9BACT|nr:MAG: internalization-related competence protein ComEC/Rec2 protein [Candidatus Nomurabacteria bacterium GW2011_GWF2_30_133]KKP28431.1 MAG: internalization-related competence protein ComEC/Rec2 protein [Candidatus Nomurabacteria bacterium GW2011_GWE2_31_40]KKP30011.1 MAG: internalization-related competence protein ComEC/Rec2 protein [Candidatus Nomurabacteria bacterium GW2011_GWF1_31_48]KKP34530.1 MAG: internalization-related competence protein ComEC/Rec2 protein [Candidatus Nomurabacteria bac